MNDIEGNTRNFYFGEIIDNLKDFYDYLDEDKKLKVYDNL